MKRLLVVLSILLSGCASDVLRDRCAGGICVPCTQRDPPSVCDDDNLCTTDSCDLEFAVCANEPLSGVTPAALVQVPRDCRVVSCVAGSAENIVDDTDLPDDGNLCTTDTCIQGTQDFSAVAPGTPCGDGLVCDDTETCRGCESALECGTDGPCRIYSCVNRACGVDNAPADTPLGAADQTDADCALLVCDGVGNVISAADVADIFDDSNPCTTDDCSDTGPTHVPVAVDSVCPSGVCDSAGSCVECTSVAQCTGAGECQDDLCSVGTCEIVDSPSGTAAPASYQTPANCELVACDGSGSPTLLLEDNTDGPDDGNDCTANNCLAGAPSHPDLAAETPCATGVCNGLGACVECASDAQCFLPDTCDLTTWSCRCVPNDCAAGGYTCGPGDDGCGVTLDCDTGATDGTESDVDCGGDPTTCSTRCDLGERCSDDSDCDSGQCADGVCCTADCAASCVGCTAALTGAADGTCAPLLTNDGNDCTIDACGAGGVTNTPNPPGDPCATGVCDGAGSCVECVDPSTCSAAGDCEVDECTGNACTIGFVSAGVTAPAGYQTAGDCRLLACDGSGNATLSVSDNGDLPNDGNDCTGDTCVAGAPVFPDLPAETLCAGGVCNGLGSCEACATDAQCTPPDVCDVGNTWSCVCIADTCVDLGQTCGAPDNGCGVGLSCGGALDGDETDLDCGGDPTTCPTRCSLGDQCNVGTDCLSGECVDGVCCDTVCDSTCEACTAALTGGTDGTCDPISAGTDPGGECPDQGAASCGSDGTGCSGLGANCNLYDAGVPCTGATECDPNACDGLGACIDNPAFPPGTFCGGGVAQPTCDPDACNAAGVCIDNPFATDGTLCTENAGVDCQGGLCLGGPPADPATDGCNCGCCDAWWISWDAVAGATYYNVSYQCSIFPEQVINVGNVTSVADVSNGPIVNMAAGTMCAFTVAYLRVQACNASGCSAPVDVPNAPITCGGGCCC